MEGDFETMEGDLDLCAYLPLGIMLEILSRVTTIKSIIKCKLVCKSWRDLIQSQYFVDSYFSRRHPHLFVYEFATRSHKILEFASEKGAPNVAVNLPLPTNKRVHSSVNGLVLLCNRESPGHMCLCNPVTREYVLLPNPPGEQGGTIYTGFGVSRVSGEYKIVCISKYENKCMCMVYTLGTGKWRMVPVGSPPTLLVNGAVCAFVGGNLYWFVHGSENWKLQICCFDLETKVLTFFPGPPHLYAPVSYYTTLSVLGDRLCFCNDSEITRTCVIWLMKEHGCWTKEFVVKLVQHPNAHGYVFPIKLFQDGDMLLGNTDYGFVYYYSKKTDTAKRYDDFFRTSCTDAVLYIPSFLPLRTLLTHKEESVQSF